MILILREQWIHAKYKREEFMDASKQLYTRGTMDGFLFKRSKIDERCRQRRFVLSERENILRYYVDNKKEPKAEIRLLDMNVAFAPEKLKTATSLQITYMNQVKRGSTRHIFVYHEDPERIVEWYTAIRSAKLNLLHVAHPTVSETELAHSLTHDFLKEGYLFKTGPRPSDGFRKRWFTLDGRKLMYHDHPMDPHPKGEIFVGGHIDGYRLNAGMPEGSRVREQGFSFHLKTLNRCYVFSAERADDAKDWMKVLKQVLDRPMTPQDAYCRSIIG
jgi:hypothetical protein